MKLRNLILVVVIALCLPVAVLQAQLPALLWSSGPSQTRGITGIFDSWSNWDPITDASALGNGSYRVGSWDDGNDSHDDVLCFQWDLPGSLGTGAVVDSAHLIIRYSTDSSRTLELRMFAPNYAIWSTDRSTIFYNAIFDQIDVMEQLSCDPDPQIGVACGVINTLDGSSGYYELWTKKNQYNDMPLTDAVQDAIDNHNSLFSLVFRAASLHLAGRLWYINPGDVTLMVYYHPPDPQEIDDVTITNYVDGTLDYRTEPESLVRGDLNQFNGYDADYAQMPHFEPPHATRTWLTQRRHLAETWLARFDDQSLPGPMKFRTWNNNYSNNYKVVFQTPLFLGDEKDLRAIPDTVFPAHLKMKREITYEYDDLPFDFKDPWAVSQSTSGDSSQAILDFYREQRTPYAPWTDTASLGVFLKQPTNNTLHYGAHYWRYYHYDSGGDSYDKKDDANLEEGDLINMDEIRYGKGTEISPSGSIQQTRVAPADNPYREYKLEFMDPDNTMEYYGIYKAHLLSDKEGQPTRSANQRKIDIDPRGVYHMVYESAGEVWYTNSEDGDNWSREELVSGYWHAASNPSIAVRDSSVYVTYVEDDIVMLKRRYRGEWYNYVLINNSSNNGSETTPVVAAGATCYSDQGDIVLVLWDAYQDLEFNMMHLYYTRPYLPPASQDSTFMGGILSSNAQTPPVFPTITCHDEMREFAAAWREGATIKSAAIHVGGGTCDKNKFRTHFSFDALPDVSLTDDSCIHAPSITHNHEGKPVVAYEARQGVPIYSNRWVNVRTYDRTSQSWNTTGYHIPFYSWTGYGEPIAASLGAHETSTDCGGYTEPGLRLAFHKNWGGGIRVGQIDCQYSEYEQITNGESFPSVVPYAGNGELREVYSAPYAVGPFEHALRSTNSYLTKQQTPNIRMVRELRINTGNAFALVGVTDLAVRRGPNVLDEIHWHALPDSLVIGVDGPAHEILYTEPFTMSSGNMIDYRYIVFCSSAQTMPVGVYIAVQLRKASDGSLVDGFSIPLRNLPSDTAIWTSWSRPLTQTPAFPVYISLGIDGSLPPGTSVGNTKVWLEDQYIPKLNVNGSVAVTLPTDFNLESNHPNPFNPGTRIPFALGRDGHVVLTVHDALGREVARLLDENLPAGRHLSHFDATGMMSGMYIARLQFGGKIQSRSMQLIK